MKTKWQPNKEQREILELLIAEQAKEKTIADFVRKYIPFSYGRWTKICKALDDQEEKSYFDEVADPDAIFAELEIVLREVRHGRAREVSTITTLNTTPLIAAQQAVREARGRETSERLVKFLAPTGGGKTILCRHLEKQFNARVAQARQAWRTSYLTFLEDVSRAVGHRIQKERRTARIETSLIDFLSDKTILLAIDEAEYFGPQAIDGIKLLLNESRLVLVLCSIAEAHDSWNRYYSFQADQLARRTSAIVEVSEVKPCDAELFFPKNLFRDQDTALKAVCRAATRFGSFSLVNRVARRLHGETDVDESSVAQAITRASAEMKRVQVINTK